MKAAKARRVSDAAATGHRDALTEYVAKKALKWTRQREVILDVFLEAHAHLTCEEISARVSRKDASIGLATVYRTLRQLEKAGMVSSFWDTSESGPARRMYSLTKAGDIFLTSWIDVLGRYQAVFRKTMEGLAPRAADGDSDEEPRAARG